MGGGVGLASVCVGEGKSFLLTFQRLRLRGSCGVFRWPTAGGKGARQSAGTKMAFHLHSGCFYCLCTRLAHSRDSQIHKKHLQPDTWESVLTGKLFT